MFENETFTFSTRISVTDAKIKKMLEENHPHRRMDARSPGTEEVLLQPKFRQLLQRQERWDADGFEGALLLPARGR